MSIIHKTPVICNCGSGEEGHVYFDNEDGSLSHEYILNVLNESPKVVAELKRVRRNMQVLQGEWANEKSVLTARVAELESALSKPEGKSP